MLGKWLSRFLRTRLQGLHDEPRPGAPRKVSDVQVEQIVIRTLMFKTMTHQLDDIPNAKMTARYGQENSPNACLICHKDKDIAWLKAELSKWNGREGRTLATSGAQPSSK